MRTSRLEAFSDGVLAIIITIMVLELHVPEGTTWHALGGSATGFLTYALSFVYVGIYWNNHHHMFQVVEQITGGVLWANLHLLFWLSLLPFTTAWMDETRFARSRPSPTASTCCSRRSPTTSLQLRDLRRRQRRPAARGAGPRPQGQALAADVPRRHRARPSSRPGWRSRCSCSRRWSWLVPDRASSATWRPSAAVGVSADRVETYRARSTSSGGSPGRPRPSPTAARAATR